VIVLDTHALIWWVASDPQLSAPARHAIEKERNDHGRILVSAISAWEIAMLVTRGRLQLAMDLDDWLTTVGEIDALSFVPVDVALGVQSVRLPGNFHADPADRMIVALARHYAAPLVTADRKILDYPHVTALW
jgi:PIN domain nuclease of toxin-antitoxin system